MATLKFGKRDPVYDPRTLGYEHYATATLTPPAKDTDNLHRFGDWLMLGNDRVGNCVFAGADHETMNWLAIAGAPNPLGLFSDSTALSDYSAVTGYRPDDPNTDQGTVVLDALNYRRHTGLIDTRGARHQIGAYVALEPGNRVHIKEAVHLFDAVGIGFQVPHSAMDQFDRHRAWTIISASPIEGGHYVPLIGYTTRYAYCVTWGRVQAMTWGFLAKYCDEAYAILSPEGLVGGESPEGLDLAALQADLTALKH